MRSPCFFAHTGAAFAGLDAGAELRSRELEVGASETRHDPPGRQTHIRAVVAVANAVDELRDLLLGKASIGTGVARLSAVLHQVRGCRRFRVFIIATAPIRNL